MDCDCAAAWVATPALDPAPTDDCLYRWDRQPGAFGHSWGGEESFVIEGLHSDIGSGRFDGLLLPQMKWVIWVGLRHMPGWVLGAQHKVAALMHARLTRFKGGLRNKQRPARAKVGAS